MPLDASSGVDDESLVLRMLDGDEDALRLFIETYGPKIRGALRGRYRGVLADPEIDEAMNWAAYRAFRSIGKYDETKATLRSWFFVIALHAAQDILKGENRNRHQELGFDPFNEESPVPQGGGDGHAGCTPRQVSDLLEAIDKMLTPRERDVTLADLAAGGQADAARLAAEMGNTVGSVHALRSKGRSKIRQYMTERGHFQNPQRSRR